jgi:hypothetical protein
MVLILIHQFAGKGNGERGELVFSAFDADIAM